MIQPPSSLLVHVIGTAIALSTVASAEAALSFEARGRYLVENYTDRDYTGHNQMWEAVQDSRGILYFGNFNSLQEYDGEVFRRIDVDGASFILELAIDDQDRIWFGAVDDLGYVEPTDNGGRRFVSLKAHLPEEASDDQFYEGVEITDTGIYWASGYGVCRWRDGKFDYWSWDPEERPSSHQMGVFAGVPYVFAEGEYPLKLVGEEWVAATEDAALRDARVVDGFEEPDGSIVLATREHGLMRMRGSMVEPVPTEADAILKSAGVKRVSRLADGSMVVGMARRGAVIIEADGSIEPRIDAGSGMKNESVNAFLEDRDGTLWVSTNIGISHVQRSAFTVFDLRDGLPDMTIFRTFDFEGTLYLAADLGMFRMTEPSAPGERPRFEEVPNVPESISDIFVHHDRLHVVAREGLIEFGDDGAAAMVLQFPHLYTPKSAEPSVSDPEIVFYATGAGMNLLRWRDGRWTDEGPIEGFSGNVVNIAQTQDGTLWVSTMTSGFFRLTPKNGRWLTHDVEVEHFPAGSAGLPAVDGFTATWTMANGAPGVGTAAGLFVWNEAVGRFEASPESGAKLTNPEIAVVAGSTSPEGRIWAVVENHHRVPPWGVGEAGRVVDGTWVPFPARLFAPSSIVQGFAFIKEPIGYTAWCGTSHGLVRIDTQALSSRPAVPPKVRIRIMETLPGERLHADGVLLPPGGQIVLDYAQRNIRFEVAAPAFGPARSILYQNMVEGFEDVWTKPTDQIQREVTNLPEGSYRLRARCVDVDGRFGDEAVVEFRVLPPWYRSFPAYAGYLMLGGFGVLGIVRWRGAALRRRNEELEETVEERTAELRVARDEADRANRAKSMFLANMSHELRTPLNGILGYTQILKRSELIQHEDRRRLAVVESSGEHLLRLINEVLDLSKIEAGRLELHPVACDLRSLVEAIADVFVPRMEEKGLRVVVEFDRELPERVVLDEQKIGQVLFNLLGNALKFTEAGEVVLRVKPAPGNVMFEVLDTGIGISKTEQASVFEPFQQVANRAVEAQGTGLGLTICAQIVSLMGGKLRVESEVGRGSRFWFEIPLSVAGGGAAVPLPGDRARVIGYTGPKQRVLIVDDLAVNRGVVREMLEPLGILVEEASGGAECLELVRQAPPDLALIDLRMAPMDGPETIRRLRALPAARDLKVVAFSASVIDFSRRDAIAMGCDDFLTKPFRERQLFDVLGRLLDISWTTTAASNEQHASENTGDAIPPAEHLDELFSLARQGDAGALRARLGCLSQENPATAAYFSRLDAIAAQYRMEEVRTILKHSIESVSGDEPRGGH